MTERKIQESTGEEKKWQPAVSIVMCTYNGAQFLKEQMDSILAQTYPITEFLIFDDGSTDNTVALLTEYAQRHSMIRLHQNPVNLGYNLNFQQGLEAANCEVIAIADQDDVWHHQKIEKMVEKWDVDMPVIHCDSQKFEGPLPTSNPNHKLYHRFKGTETKKLFISNSISGHALMLRKSFLPKVLPLHVNIYYDWWIGAVASCNGGVDFIDEVLVYQRLHRSNASKERGKSKKESVAIYREETVCHLNYFLTISQLSTEDKRVGEELIYHIKYLNGFSSRLRLFAFMLKHRRWIYYVKKRKVAIFSHIKHSYRWAFY